MDKVEFWVWKERDGTFCFCSIEEARTGFLTEAAALDAAVRTAQKQNALYSIAFAKPVAEAA